MAISNLFVASVLLICLVFCCLIHAGQELHHQKYSTIIIEKHDPNHNTFLHISNFLYAAQATSKLGFGQSSMEKIDCSAECNRRCSLASRHNMCIRACRTCCTRCDCVPPGTHGNKEKCPCYANMTTHGGRKKCP